MNSLPGAGSTAILYRLKLGLLTVTIPTIGFNVETIRYKNMELTFWDAGGGLKMREIYSNHYYGHTDGLIYVVDSTDREGIQASKKLLHKALTKEGPENVPVLIFANKQDLGGMSVEEVTEKLELASFTRRSWKVFGSSAVTGDGLHEGLEWLGRAMTTRG